MQIVEEPIQRVKRWMGSFHSALAGSPNVLPFEERKSARYAREIKGLSKEHHHSDIMTSVQAVKKQKKGDAPWQTV